MPEGSPYRVAASITAIEAAAAPARIDRSIADRRALWLLVIAALACLEVLGFAQLRPRPLRVPQARAAWRGQSPAFSGAALMSWEASRLSFHVHAVCDCWRHPSCCDPLDPHLILNSGAQDWTDHMPLFAIAQCYPDDRFDRFGTSFVPAYGPRTSRRHRAAATVDIGTRIDLVRIVAPTAVAAEIVTALPAQHLEACHTRALFDHPGETLRVELSRTPSPAGDYRDEVQIWPRRVRDPRVRCCLQMAAMEMLPSDPSSPVRVELRLTPTKSPLANGSPDERGG